MVVSSKGQFLMMDKQVPIPPLKDMPAIDFLGLNVLHLLLKRSHAAIQNGFSKQCIQVSSVQEEKSLKMT